MIEILLLIVAGLLIVWSNIITYNIPAMEFRSAKIIARILSVALIIGALGITSYVG